MNDLEWLARNVHEWPKQVIDCFIAIAPTPEGWSFYTGPGESMLTHAQWQDERERLGLNGNKDNDIQQVTLKPGDYVDVRNTTPEQRKAIAYAFVSAGAAPTSAYPYDDQDYPSIGWDAEDGETYGFMDDESLNARLFTIGQVLSATNAGGVKTSYKVGDKCEIQHLSHTTYNCVITYVGDGVGCYKTELDGGEIKEFSFAMNSVKVVTERDIEDRAIEEMLNALEGIKDVTCNRATLEYLYRAGYRKTEV